MPLRHDKWKDLFAGLGRPTKRGIRKCPKCGTVNGTRGNSCKNKACDVVFRNNGASKKTSTEACKLTLNIPGLQIFSVRLRDRGPDYRNFVQLPLSATPLTDGNQETSFYPKCYVESCIRNKVTSCGHLEAAHRCFSESEPLTIEHSTVTSPNIPADQQQMLAVYINESNAALVQRVSKTSFVVKCEATIKHPLGYLHIMFFKHDKEDGTLEKKFLCTCKPFRVQNRDNEAQGDGVEIGSKLCVHYHACLCAFASDVDLSSEFACFLAQPSPDCTPTIFNQLHLVTLPAPTGGSTLVEGIDANNSMTVEILRENISLMESNAFNTVDDTTLQNVNVQSLEGVLSDQIIVTNVDDSLSFGDATGLDLDDGSSQVCQIFTSAQNAIQLANAFSNSENVHQTVNITNSTVLTSPNDCGGKRRRHLSNDETMEVTALSATHSVHPLTVTNHYEINTKSSPPKSSGACKGFQSQTITYTTPTTAISPPSPLPLSPELELSNSVVDGFDRWLSQVNERLNTTMNYQFSGKPEPIVYFISSEYFECLKDRITSGVKKKRLPNQTVIISRTNKPPAGTFTKHVWKITNLLHIQQIFYNQVVPLKLSQYFIKGGNGIFQEWTPPNETDRKNQHIKPHLHSTFLKVGKNDPNAIDNVPFVIEWIPDILPQSKLGELSLIFEFGRNAPREHPVNTKDN